MWRVALFFRIREDKELILFAMTLIIPTPHLRESFL